jgi:hypothetical protein
LFTSNLESFPGTVFIMLGSLNRPDLIVPKLEMFTKRRLQWMKPLGVRACGPQQTPENRDDG